MPKRVIIRPGQVHPLVASAIPNLEIVNTGVTVDDQEKYNKYAQAVQLAQMRQDAAKHGHRPEGEIKEDHSDWARAHTFEQNNPKLAKAVQFVPVANTVFNIMKSGDTRPEKLNVGKAVVSDAMALAGLGMATKAFGPTTAIVSDIGGTAGAYAGNELGERLVETGKISPEAGMYVVPGLTWLGGSLGAGTAFKTYRGWQRALEPDVPVVKQEYNNWGGEFVDDVAMNSRQPYLPKKSKLSVDELAGIPKGERMVESPEYLELKRVYNEFANKYNYPEAKSKNYEELVRESRKLINRHNTFTRGVEIPRAGEAQLEAWNSIPGTINDKLRYAATHPKPGGQTMFIGTGQHYGKEMFTVRLPVDFSDQNPVRWFETNNPKISVERGGMYEFIDKFVRARKIDGDWRFDHRYDLTTQQRLKSIVRNAIRMFENKWYPNNSLIFIPGTNSNELNWYTRTKTPLKIIDQTPTKQDLLIPLSTLRGR